MKQSRKPKAVKPTLAEKTIIEAERYSHFAVEHMSLTNWKRKSELEKALVGYRINFLFPNMDYLQRAVIEAMYWVSRCVRLGRATKPPIGESAMSKIEGCFARSRAVAERNVFPQLTPLQQEIASMEFMS